MYEGDTPTAVAKVPQKRTAREANRKERTTPQAGSVAWKLHSLEGRMRLILTKEDANMSSIS